MSAPTVDDTAQLARARCRRHAAGHRPCISSAERTPAGACPRPACCPRGCGVADLQRVLAEVGEERDRQSARWGDQKHPAVDPLIDGLPAAAARPYAAGFYGVPTATNAQNATDAAARAGQCSWVHIAVEELAELVDAAAIGDLRALRSEALQLAAVCVAFVQAMDRRALITRDAS